MPDEQSDEHEHHEAIFEYSLPPWHKHVPKDSSKLGVRSKPQRSCRDAKTQGKRSSKMQLLGERKGYTASKQLLFLWLFLRHLQRQKPTILAQRSFLLLPPLSNKTPIKTPGGMSRARWHLRAVTENGKKDCGNSRLGLGGSNATLKSWTLLVRYAPFAPTALRLTACASLFLAY